MQEAVLSARLTDNTDDVPVNAIDLAGGTAVVYTNRCPGKSTPNEDSAAVFALSPTSAVLVVADGVGGSRSGEEASRIVIDCLRNTLRAAARTGEALRSAILTGIEHANAMVLELGCGAASTLAVVEINDHFIRPYHVGDSMILNMGQRGKIKLQTVSHSPVGFAVEAGLLDARAAMHHRHRHIVSNVVGQSDMRVEIGSALKLDPRDTLVLASDGLSDNLHVGEIIDMVRKGPLDAGVERLALSARQRMLHPKPALPTKPDDLTIVAYRPMRSARARRKPPRRKSA